MLELKSVWEGTTGLPPATTAVLNSLCPRFGRPLIAVGTYLLVEEEQESKSVSTELGDAPLGGADNDECVESSSGPRKKQRRVGSIELYTWHNENEVLVREQSLETNFGIFDLCVHPMGYLLAGTSRGTIEVFRLVPDYLGRPRLSATATHDPQLCANTDEEVMITKIDYFPPVPQVVGFTSSKGHVRFLNLLGPDPYPPFHYLSTGMPIPGFFENINRDLAPVQTEAVWTLALQHRSQSIALCEPNGPLVTMATYYGGDDNEFAVRNLHVQNISDPSAVTNVPFRPTHGKKVGPPPIPTPVKGPQLSSFDSTSPDKVLFRFGTGVTAIFPLMNGTTHDPVLIGCYDGFLRVVDHTVDAPLQTLDLQGGVWRLTLVNFETRLSRAERLRAPLPLPNSRNLWKHRWTLLASCMHAGSRLVRVCWVPNEHHLEYDMELLASWNGLTQDDSGDAGDSGHTVGTEDADGSNAADPAAAAAAAAPSSGERQNMLNYSSEIIELDADGQFVDRSEMIAACTQMPWPGAAFLKPGRDRGYKMPGHRTNGQTPMTRMYGKGTLIVKDFCLPTEGRRWIGISTSYYEKKIVVWRWDGSRKMPEDGAPVWVAPGTIYRY